MDADRIRATIEPTVEDWLRDYKIPRDKSHWQLVNRIVAAVLAMQEAGVFREELPPSQANPFACGD